MPRWITVCALLALILAAALHFQTACVRVGEWDTANAGVSRIAEARPLKARGLPQRDNPYLSEFSNLIAAFQGESDPFLREKRAAAFQERIDQLASQEVLPAYQAAVAIAKENPSESAIDLRDRLDQRWRELEPGAVDVIDSGAPESDSLPHEIIALSDTDPASAAKLALEQLPANQEQTNILIGIVQRFAAVDARSALAWVRQFPEGELRDRAFSELRRVERANRGHVDQAGE